MFHRPRTHILLLLLLCFFAIAIIIVSFVIKNQQDIRQHAAGNTCPFIVDTMFVVDVSGSTINNRPSEIAQMHSFVTYLQNNNTQTLNHIGLVTYAGGWLLNFSLQNGEDYNSLHNAIDNMPFIDNASAGQDNAIDIANQQIFQFGRPGIQKVVVMLTDRSASQAMQKARDGFNQSGTAFYIVGYDVTNSTVKQTLQALASDTGGTYHDDTGSDVTISQQIGESIASEVICPQATPALPIPTPTGTPIPTNTPMPTAIPSNTPTPTLTPVPTTTPTPIPTKLSYSVILHGIGIGGDNANPTANSLSNKNPQTTTKTIDLTIFDANANPVGQFSNGSMTYQPASQQFTGTIAIGNSLTSGQYTIKIKTDKYLRRQIPGITTITANALNTLTPVSLITGDVNNDNALSILDYSTIIDCYSGIAPAKNCADATKKFSADLNDDGNVNQTDYNLFLRELSIQAGD